MHKIKLKSARFFSFHGVFPQEQKLGNWYEVDVEVIGDFSLSSKSDNVDHTVDYQVLFEIVRQQMLHPQNLLETVLDTIYNSIVSHYPFVESTEIKLRKLNPPVGGTVAYSEVTLRKEK